jgi:hypothetical protein
MKTKFVHCGFTNCKKCCFKNGSKECRKYTCGGGYMKEIKRAGKYERLLKVILKSDCLIQYIHGEIGESITQSQFDELSAIKERIEKKGKK